MGGQGWWQPRRSRTAQCIAWSLALLMGVETLGCAGGARVIPSSTHISVVSPWRYYDLWEALRRGRGVLIGTSAGATIAGKFVSGGAKTIRVSTTTGQSTIPISSIRYIINVIDLSHARDGALAGGLIGFGTGFALSYATGGTRTPNARPARAARLARASEDDKSSTGESQSTNSESSTNTTPTASSTEAGQSTQSSAGADAQAASSESSGGGSSATTDPTQTGSNVYEEGGSSGSSVGGTSGDNTSPTTQQSNQSAGGSNVVVNIGATNESSSQSSTGGTAQPSGGARGSSVSPAWRMFFFTVGFAALGTAIGWAIGRRMKKSVPRVDYVLFPENLANRGNTSPDQLLADQIVLPSGQSPAETLLPGSRFDSPRSAMQFDQFAHEGTIIRLADGLSGVITEADARSYHLFPTVKNFVQATIVSCGISVEMMGTECRYLAVVTSKSGGTPTVSLQRLSPRDVVRLSTQVNLIQSGIIP